MNARRRELRRQKKELADHNRAMEARRYGSTYSAQIKLQEIAAAIESTAELEHALGLVEPSRRESIAAALKPYLRPGIALP